MKTIKRLSFALFSCLCSMTLTAQTILDNCDFPYIDPQDASSSGDSRDTLLYTTFFEEKDQLQQYFIDINAFGGQQVDRAAVFAIMPDSSLKPQGTIAFGNCVDCVDGFALVIDDSLQVSGINNVEDIELWLDGFNQPSFSLTGSLQTLAGAGRLSGSLPACAIGLQVVYQIFNNPSNTTTEFSTQIVCPQPIKDCSIQASGRIDCPNGQIQLQATLPDGCFSDNATGKWFDNAGWVSFEFNPTRPIGNNVGTYYLEVTDECCTYLDSVVIEIEDFLMPLDDQTVCEQAPVTLVGVGGQDHFWELPDQSIANDSLLFINQTTTADSGSYILHAFNEEDCEVTDTVLLTVLTPTTPVWQNRGYCFGDTIPFVLENDSLFSQLQWFDPSNQPFNQEELIDFSALNTGNYTLEATDNNGCSTITVFLLTAEPQTELEIIQTEVCDSVFVTLQPTDLLYEWTNGQLGNTLGVNLEGTYQVSVTEADGCQFVQDILVERTDSALVEIAVEQPICPNDPTGKIEFLVRDQDIPIIFSIDGGASYSIQNRFDKLFAGIYNIVIEDDLGCIRREQVEIFAPDTLDVQILADNKIEVRPNTTITLETTSLGDVTQFQWVPRAIDSGQPTTSFLATEEDLNVRIIVEDERGCLASDGITIKTVVGDIFIPNAFSPNDDGQNETFTFYSDNTSGEIIESLRIFDRWGTLLYEVAELPLNSSGWNGEAHGRSLPEGVYTYAGVVRFGNGVKKRFEGGVTLMR